MLFRSPFVDECARRFLNEGELARFASIPEELRRTQLKALLESPIREFTEVNEAYFRARWGETLALLHPGKDVAVLEVATGNADMIPQAMARSRAGSRYVTANMNVAANRSLLERTAGLDLRLELVEDDAVNIQRHVGPDAFDVIAFQHGLNDVIQAVLCGREGVDTAHADWMELLPRMIRILREETGAGTLESHAKPGLLHLMGSLLGVLKRGGVIAINHYMFQLDLDWGYPPALWEGWIPVARTWLRDLEGVREIELQNHDPNWWLFLKKV